MLHDVFKKNLMKVTGMVAVAATAFVFAVPAMPAFAKTDYEKVYKQYSENNPYFKSEAFPEASYADLNGDGTPELILWSKDDKADDWILSIHRGKVVASNLRGTNTVKYVKGKNRIYVSGKDAATGFESYDDIYTLKNGSLRWIAGGSKTSAGKYDWDGKTVSKKTYSKDLKKAKESSKYTNSYNKISVVSPSEW